MSNFSISNTGNFTARGFKQNITSGILVSFIALPLSIAISLASGFPVLSGVITAIIGGLVVSQLSGSFVTINGPAAGMIVVILDSVQRLGGEDLTSGYKRTLAAIVLASLMQFVFSYTKLPELMRKFPEIVIRGMMVSIGTIVILKQIFTLFGYKIPKDGMLKLFTDIPEAFLGMEWDVFMIGVFIILMIILHGKYSSKSKLVRAVPIYFVAIIVGSLLAYVMNIRDSHHFLLAEYAHPVDNLFLKIPSSLVESIAFPDFISVFSFEFTMSTLTIFAIGTLETVLSAIAVDKIDPLKRTTNLKKDVRAVGIGNFIAGLIGGLPMIAEIVRSSANVKYGANSKWSNFFHGFSLALMITVLSKILNFVPLCVLAAMLILIGYNLINIKLLAILYKESKANLLVIFSVIFFTIYIDLLVGIASGAALYFVLKKFFNVKLHG